MSIYHFTVKMHSRAKNKKLRALRAYAYRAGTRVVDPITQAVYNSTAKRHEVIRCNTITPDIGPAWKDDPLELWHQVQQIEKRVDAGLFREFECALPKEVASAQHPEAWVALIEAFIRDQLTPHGVLVTYAIHSKPSNPHVHMMCTTRTWGDDGFGLKNRSLDTFKMLYQWRASWADHCNQALQTAGRFERVTHKSYAELGIKREATSHVGPVHSEQSDPGYAQKRQEVIASNRKVRDRNLRRKHERQRLAQVHCQAGIHAVQMVRTVKPWVPWTATAQPSIPTPLQPTVASYPLAHRVVQLEQPAATIHSVDDTAEHRARQELLNAWPGALDAFAKLQRWRSTMGRTWSWSIFLAQYQRISKTQDNPLAELLTKELMWVVSRAPHKVASCLQAADPPDLIRAASAVRSWAIKHKPQCLPALETLIESARATLPEFRQRTSPVDREATSTNNDEANLNNRADIPTADTDTPSTFAQSLAAFPELAHLVPFLTDIVVPCQRLAKAIDRAFTPAILFKRLQRLQVEGVLDPRITLDSLVDALLTKDLVFAAKRRPHRLMDALKAVPPLRRTQFECVVRDVLAGTVYEAGHDRAAQALSEFQQRELQARWSIEQVLTQQQIADFEHRRAYLNALGQEYSWHAFQNDINRYAQSEQGWQRAWWDVQVQSVNPNAWQTVSQHVPAWYVVPDELRHRFESHGQGGMVQTGEGRHGQTTASAVHKYAPEGHRNDRHDANFDRCDGN
jgi:hypothetical protein